MYLFQRIEELMLECQDTRYFIGEFLLKEKAKFYKYSMDDIAKLTHTSKSTLVRFAKSLGFHGWKDFYVAMIDEAKYLESNNTTVDVNFPFHENDSYRKVIDTISRLQIESIKDTSELINEKMLELAVIRISKARRIIIFGMKPNSYYAESLQWKFLSIGVQMYVGSPGELGMLSKLLTKEDCAIMISYAGNSHKEPVTYIDTLKSQGVPMIGITSLGDNYMRQNIDCIFSISSREKLYSKIATFSTEQSIMFIFNVLYSCYFKKEYHKNLKYKIENSKTLEKSRKAIISSMQEI